MAKGTKLGATAAQIVTIGDLDALVDRAGHQKILDGIEQVELAETEQRAEQYVGHIEARIRRVDQRIDRRDQRRQEENSTSIDKQNLAQAWRESGIRSKFVLVDAPFVVRFISWIVFGAVDFYLFATAMAIALNEDQYDEAGIFGMSSGFWTGGVMGLMVFALGVALAHLLRQSDYIRAQRELKRELKEKGQELIVGANSLHLYWFVGVLFGILNCVALLVRAQSVDFRWWPLEFTKLGPLLLQMLVPFVAVGAEAIMFDPTEVRLRKPGPIDSLLYYQRRKLEERLEQRRLKVSKFRDIMTARYNTERASLKVFHDSQGFPITNDTDGV